MRRTLVLTLMVAAIVLGLSVGESSASSANYPDGSFSRTVPLGSGFAFLFFDFPGDNDIFIHVIDFNDNLLNVTLNNQFFGALFFLNFEGFNGGFMQFGVFRCQSFGGGCNFTGRVGTLFI